MAKIVNVKLLFHDEDRTYNSFSDIVDDIDRCIPYDYDLIGVTVEDKAKEDSK